MNSYDQIFNTYTTIEGIPFNMLSRAVRLPNDKTLDMYGQRYINTNTAWTIMSYMIYGTIENWWLLNLLNPDMPLYAVEGNKIYYVKPDFVDMVKNAIGKSINI